VPSVFDILGEDHDEVERVLARLESGPTALRQKIVEELIIRESRHEAIEEVHFWPAVRERHPRGDDLADTAARQEQEVREVLGLLGWLDASMPEFENVLARYIKAGRDHFLFEETRVWPGLSQALSERDAADLGQRLERARKTMEGTDGP
jgi:hypothetical protein